MTTDKELSGNKGEWSEFYTFCYLLDSGKLIVADRNLEPSDDTYLPIVKIIRPEKGKMKGYAPDGEKDIVEITMGEEIIDSVPKSEFRKTLKVVYDKSVSGSGVGAFSIPEIVPFLKKIYCDKIKADPLHKEDIKVDKQEKQRWGKMMQDYFDKADELQHVLCLVDIRHEPTEDDKQMNCFLRETEIPFTVIATKADKISRGARSKYLAPICCALSVQPWEIICFSGEDGTGRDDLLRLLDGILHPAEA